MSLSTVSVLLVLQVCAAQTNTGEQTNISEQTKTWEQWIAAGEKSHTAGQYANAESSFRKALQQAEKSGSPAHLAETQNDLATILQLRGDFSGAEAALMGTSLPIVHRAWARASSSP